MGLSLRLWAALLLLPLSLILLHPQAASADDRCKQWVGVSLSLKRKTVQESFAEQEIAGRSASVDRCLRDSATQMANEIDERCRAGGDLAPLWRDAGLGWVITCLLVAERVDAGGLSTPKLRTDLRSSVKACFDEGKPADACRTEIRERDVSGSGTGRLGSECQRFQALPRESRLLEVEDRIRGRFLTTPDVARCMSAKSGEILNEIATLCRRGDEAAKAWSQVLGIYTDRCLDRDVGF